MDGTGCDVSIGFDHGDVAETGSVTLTSALSNIVFGIRSVLESFMNIGDIFVEGSGSDASSGEAEVSIVFYTNGGILPLVTVSPVDGSCLYASVDRQVAGSLVSEVQEITVTSQSQTPNGEFAILFSVEDVPGISRSQIVESSFLDIKSSADDVKHALSLMSQGLGVNGLSGIYRKGLGLVNVTKSDSVLNADNLYEWSWRVEFLTRGGDLPNLVLVSSRGFSDPAYHEYSSCTSSCVPLDDSISGISVDESVKGTELISGFYKIGIVSGRDALGNKVWTYSDPISAHTRASYLETALLALPGVEKAYVKNVDCNADNGACSWVFHTYTSSGSSPEFKLDLEKLRGGNLHLYLTQDAVGTAMKFPEMNIALRFSDPSIGLVHIPAISTNVSSDELESLFTSKLAPHGMVASVSKELSPGETSPSIVVSIGYSYDHSISFLSKDIPSEHWPSEVPSLEATGAGIKTIKKRVVFGSDRALISIFESSLTPVYEKQTLSCSSTTILPTSGHMEDSSNPETFRISYRFATTTDVWIHSFITPDGLIPCIDHSTGAPVPTGTPCAGDGKTVLEKLRDLTTLPFLRVHFTNSTTGRLCPSEGDIAEKFTTVFEFAAADNEFVSTDKVVSGSDGDVPPLLLVNMQSIVDAGNTDISVVETVKGGNTNVREVQQINILQSDMRPNFVQLKYGARTAVVSAIASEAEMASAVRALSGDDVTVLRSNVVSPHVGYSWTVTFSESFGRALLVHAVPCTSLGNATDHSHLLTDSLGAVVDTWAGSSCLLGGINLIQSYRIVAGHRVHRGYLNISINDHTFEPIELASAETMQLQMTQTLQTLFTNARVSKSSLLNDGKEVILLYLSTGSEERIEKLNVSAQHVLSSPQMCTKLKGTEEVPCYFPFILTSNDSNGTRMENQYSGCLPHRYRAHITSCAVVYDPQSEGMDNTVGECSPCSSVLFEEPPHLHVVAQPLRKSINFVGNAEEVREVLNSLVYASGTVAPQRFRNPSSVYDYVEISLVSDHVDGNLADMHFPVGIKEQETSTPLIISESQSYFGREDSIIFISRLSINSAEDIGSTSPDTLLHSHVHRCTISISVNYGDVFLSSYQGLLFSHENITGQLTFSGSYFDVNRALSGLIYSPINNWHSSVSKDVESAVQAVSILYHRREDVQVLRTSVSGAGKIDLSQSNFKLSLDCGDVGLVLMAANRTSHVASSGTMIASISASALEMEINTMIESCLSKLEILSVAGTENSVELYAHVTKSPQSALEKNTFSWEIAFDTPALSYNRSTVSQFPMLKLTSASIVLESIVAPIVMGSPSIVLSRKVSGALLGSGQMRLGYLNSWGTVISLNASAAAVKSSILSMEGFNVLSVEREALYDSQHTLIGHKYLLTFPFSNDWPVPRVSSQSLYDPLSAAYGPMHLLDAQVMSGDASIQVEMVQHGHVEPDILTVDVFTEPLEAAKPLLVPAATISVPLYILPTVDLPTITCTERKIDMAEGGSILLTTVGIECPDCDTHNSTVATIHIVSYIGTIQLLSLANSTLVEYSYSEGIMRLRGSVTHLQTSLKEILFIPQSHFYGSGVIWIGISLDDIEFKSLVIEVMVKNVPDVMAFQLPTHAIRFEGNTSNAFASPVVLIDHDDLLGSAQYTVNISVGALLGTIEVPIMSEFSPLEYSPVKWISRATNVIRGSRSSINVILSETHVTCFVSKCLYHLSAYKHDTGSKIVDVLNVSTSSKKLTGGARAVTDDTIFYLLEDTAFNLSQISIEPSNELALHEEVELFLSCNKGHFSFTQSHGDDGEESIGYQVVGTGAVLHIRGSAKAISTACSRGIFHPPVNYFGSLSFSINVITGSTYSNYLEIMGYVEPVDDPPTVTTKMSSLLSLQTSPIAVASSTLDLFDAVDIDDKAYMLLELSCQEGELDLSLASSLVEHTAESATLRGKKLQVFVMPSDLADSLSTLVYHAPVTSVLTESVTVTVTSLAFDHSSVVDMNVPISFSSQYRGSSDSSTVKFSVKIPVEGVIDCYADVAMREGEEFDLSEICSLDVTGPISNPVYDIIISVDVGYISISGSIISESSILEYKGGSYLKIRRLLSEMNPREAFAGLLYVGNTTGVANISVLAVIYPTRDNQPLIELAKSVEVDILSVDNLPTIAIPGEESNLNYQASIFDNSSFVLPPIEIVDDGAIVGLKIDASGGVVVFRNAEYFTRKISILDDASDSGEVLLTGSPEDITDLFALRSFVFLPNNLLPSQSSSQCTLRITVIDREQDMAANSGEMSGFAVEKIIYLLVMRSDLLPKIFISQENIEYNEGSHIPLVSHVSLAAGMMGLTDTVEVSISTVSGIFTYATLPSIKYTREEGLDTTTITGNVAEMRRLLESLVFVPYEDTELFAEILFAVTEVNGSYRGATVNTLLSLYITPVNDAPVILYDDFPDMLSPGQSIRLGSFIVSLSDPDVLDFSRSTNTYTLLVSTSCGYIHITPTDELRAQLHSQLGLLEIQSVPSSYSSATSCGIDIEDALQSSMITSQLGLTSVEASGSLEMLNTLIGSLSFVAPSDYLGTTSLTIELNDKGNTGVGGELTDRVQPQFQVLSFSSVLRILSQTDVLIFEHDTIFASAFFGGIHDIVSDDEDNHEVYELVVRARENQALSALLTHVDFHCQNASESINVVKGENKLILRGSRAAISNAFSSTIVKPPPYYHGVLEIHMVITSESSGFSDEAFSRLRIEAMNDPPIVEMSEISIIEDTASPFILSIFDPDVTFLVNSKSRLLPFAKDVCCQISVALTCFNCFFWSNSTLSEKAHTLLFRGFLLEVNAVITQLMLQGESDFHGTATVNVEVDDLGTYGFGRHETIGRNMSIFINPVNDPPRVIVPSSLHLVKGANKITGIKIEDIDGSNDTLTVVLSVEGGSLEIPSESLVRTEILTLSSNVLQLTALADDVTESLSALLLYVTFPQTETASLTVQATDQSGSIGEATANIFVSAINSSPRISTAEKPGSIEEDSMYSFSDIVQVSDDEMDADAHSSALIHATVAAAHRSQLNVQRIVTSAPHVDQVQRISLSPITSSGEVTGGSFKLGLDLTADGCGSSTTDSITFDADISSDTDAPEYLTSSIVKHLRTLECVQQCRIGISVARPPDDFLHHNETRDSRMYSILLPSRAMDWLVVFHNSSSNLPLLTSHENTLTTTPVGGAAVEIEEYVPSNILGGTFRVGVGDLMTDPIPHNASSNTVSLALESMGVDALEAVTVSRSDIPDLHGGYEWRATFFSADGVSPKLVGDYSELTGFVYINTLDSHQREVDPAKLTISEVQPAEGRPRVLAIKTSAVHIDEEVEVSLTTSSYDQFDWNANVFEISIADPVTGRSDTIGPIYASTVAMASDEMKRDAMEYGIGNVNFDGTDNPTLPRVGHSQIPGTAPGESMQSLFRSIWFFDSYADDVSVSLTSVSIGGQAIHSWRVTFINATFTSLDYTIGRTECTATNISYIGDGWCDWDTVGSEKVFNLGSQGDRAPSAEYNNAACQWDGGDCCVETCVGAKSWDQEEHEVGIAINRTYACGEYDHEPPNSRPYHCLDPKHVKTRAAVRVVTKTNRVGGTFQLVAGGYYSRAIPFDASSTRMQGALENLPVVRSPDNGIGALSVGRTGPNLEGAYTWYLAFIEESEITYDITVNSIQSPDISLSGLGARVEVLTLREGPMDYGLRIEKSGLRGVSLLTADPTARNLSTSLSMGTHLSFLGSTSHVSAALSSLEYRPPQNWFGNLSLVIRVNDMGFYGDGGPMEASLVYPLEVISINDPPVILWRNEELKNLGSEKPLAQFSVYEGISTNLGDEVVYDDTSQQIYSQPATSTGASSMLDTHRKIVRQGLQISDIDIGANDISVRIWARRGRLEIKEESFDILNETHAVFNHVHSSGEVIWPGMALNFTGYIGDVNRMLSLVSYLGPPSGIGYDHIHIVATDDFGTSVHSELLVKIVAVNSAPVITVEGTNLGTLYDDNTTWEVGVIYTEEDRVTNVGNYFSISDADFHEENYSEEFGGPIWAYSFSASFTVGIGKLILPVRERARVVNTETAETLQAGDFAASINVTGSYHDVIKVAKHIEYHPLADWYGVDVLEIEVDDMNSIGVFHSKRMSRRILLDHAEVPDAPHIVLPLHDSGSSLLKTLEDTVGIVGSYHEGWVDMNFGGSVMNISAQSFSIEDADAKVLPANGRYVVRIHDEDERNVITGDMSNNTIMDGNRSKELREHDFVWFTTNYGNSSKYVANTYALRSSSDLHYFEYDANERAYAANVTMTITLKCHHGKMSLLRVPESIEFMYGAGFQEDYFVFAGGLIDVNVALNGLMYLPDQNWNSEHDEIMGVYMNEVIELRVVDANALEDYAKVVVIISYLVLYS